MRKISDERLAEMLEYCRVDTSMSEMENVITELQSLRSQPAGVRVKGLEWEMFTEAPLFDGDEARRYWRARDPLGGCLFVNVHTEDFDGEASLGGTKYRTAAAAMNEVEDLRRDRILSALEPQQEEAEYTPTLIEYEGEGEPYAEFVGADEPTVTRTGYAGELLLSLDRARLVGIRVYTTPAQKVQESQTVSVTDEMVERGAAAFWRENYGRLRGPGKDQWPDDVLGGSQDLFRRGVRAALTAALEPSHE